MNLKKKQQNFAKHRANPALKMQTTTCIAVKQEQQTQNDISHSTVL